MQAENMILYRTHRRSMNLRNHPPREATLSCKEKDNIEPQGFGRMGLPLFLQLQLPR